MSLQSISDQDLIKEYLKGDERSFEILLSRHQQKIFSTIFLFVKDNSLAQDIFQDVFIKIIDTLRRGKYNHEGKFSQWAMRIAYNMCVDQFRKRKRKPTISKSDEFDIFDVIESSEINAEQNIIQSQTHSKIRELLEELPPEQKEVVVLRHYADMSFKEISQLTNVSINTALGRMRYALINMRKLVEERHVFFH